MATECDKCAGKGKAFIIDGESMGIGQCMYCQGTGERYMDDQLKCQVCCGMKVQPHAIDLI